MTYWQIAQKTLKNIVNYYNVKMTLYGHKTVYFYLFLEISCGRIIVAINKVIKLELKT